MRYLSIRQHGHGVAVQPYAKRLVGWILGWLAEDACLASAVNQVYLSRQSIGYAQLAEGLLNFDEVHFPKFRI